MLSPYNLVCPAENMGQASGMAAPCARRDDQLLLNRLFQHATTGQCTAVASTVVSDECGRDHPRTMLRPVRTEACQRLVWRRVSMAGRRFACPRCGACRASYATPRASRSLVLCDASVSAIADRRDDSPQHEDTAYPVWFLARPM